MSYEPDPDDDNSLSDNSLSGIIRAALSYDTNLMLAAIISLLLVILFVLFLHLYTRWYLVQARRRSRSSVTVPRVLGSRLHNRSFTIIDTTSNPGNSNSPGKFGLPFSIIASLPLFVYKVSSEEDRDSGLECAICLSAFEEEEIGRKLPGCGHAFHVECIDMWLRSHSSCPICRASIRCNHSNKIDHLEIEMADQEQESESVGLTISNEEELRLENVAPISDQITEPHEMADAAAENDSGVGGSSSSSIGESIKKLLSTRSSCSSSSRSGGKIHPSSDDNGNESEGFLGYEIKTLIYNRVFLFNWFELNLGHRHRPVRKSGHPPAAAAGDFSFLQFRL
ncbi:unnamed protein product [Lactuca virosa]|uniref:RING-type E3 ubiquitin transferase n=1 Tax=Lactuca virosa TaxID=75947 RepID=A0AAU9PA08_9ASTR|nr:unnamed protein product [Lactuca virosa]